MAPAAIPCSWRPRRRPLPAVAAFARGAPALALARRLLAEGAGATRFAAVGAPGCLFLAGPDLPWVEGITYLGSDSEAPSLYMPTLIEPTWPLDLLTAALLRRGLALPCAVLRGREEEFPPGPFGSRMLAENSQLPRFSPRHNVPARPGPNPQSPSPDSDGDWIPASAGMTVGHLLPGESSWRSVTSLEQSGLVLLSAATARPLDLDLLTAWLTEQLA